MDRCVALARRTLGSQRAPAGGASAGAMASGHRAHRPKKYVCELPLPRARTHRPVARFGQPRRARRAGPQSLLRTASRGGSKERPWRPVSDHRRADGRNPLVFAHADGSGLHPCRVSRRFARLVKASGLPRLRLHDLRHTHATIALRAGVHPKIVSERLGHATVTITLDLYSHASESMQSEAAGMVSDIVFSEGGRRS